MLFRLWAAAGVLVASVARGEPAATERALAAALFEEGRALLAKNRVAEACPKLVESHRLDPGGGTLLNVALCHEKEGRLATAFAEFREALAWAQRDGRAERVAAAEEHLAGLRPRLSGVVVALTPDADRAGLTLSLDGVALGRGSVGARLPLDPGPHELVATHADGRRTTLPFVVAGEGVFTPLEVKAPSAPPPASVSVGPTASAPAGATRSTVPPPESRPAPTDRRVGPWVLVGAGALATGVGLAFGLRARSLRSDVRDLCPDLSRCTAEGRSKNDDAVRAADVSTVVTSLGLVAVGVGVALVVRKPVPQAARADLLQVRW